MSLIILLLQALSATPARCRTSQDEVTAVALAVSEVTAVALAVSETI